jgi:hypothetical protein
MKFLFCPYCGKAILINSGGDYVQTCNCNVQNFVAEKKTNPLLFQETIAWEGNAIMFNVIWLNNFSSEEFIHLN